MDYHGVGSLNSLADYGLGESDIEDSDAEMDSEETRVQPVARPSIPVVKSRVKISARLVSYDDFAEEEDGEEVSDKKTEEEVEINEEAQIDAKGANEEKEKNAEESKQMKETSDDAEAVTDDAVSSKAEGKDPGSAEPAEKKPEEILTRTMPQLPPEPIGRCSNKVQEKIQQLLERKQRGNRDLNYSIQKRKDFINPSIYEKLVTFCNLNETGSNYPKSLFDPTCWTEESFYENLSKAQKEAYEKKEKEKAKLARTQIEFITGTKKPGAGEETKKRKSKWDVTAPGLKTATPPTKVGILATGSAPPVGDVTSVAKKAKLSS